MDSTIMAAFIGAVATITSALIGLFAVKRREQNNAYLASELQHLYQTGYRIQVPKPEEYGVRVIVPNDQAKVGKEFDVRGTYKILPPGQRFWISTVRNGANGNHEEFWPQGVASHSDGKWHGHVYNLGGKSGDIREILILAVGKDGDALFRYYGKVGKVTKSWPSISMLTNDIVTCARVIVQIG